MEKSRHFPSELPAPVAHQNRREGLRRFTLYAIFPVLIIFVLFRESLLEFAATGSHNPPESQCRQVNALRPSKGSDRLEDMYEYLSSPEFEKHSISRLSRAVQVRTESWDNYGPIGEDPRWDALYDFQDYLKDTFPRIHEYMNPEVINTHGLVYTWKGSDQDLKPLLLMAHQDVVPVTNDTLESWSYPPFSGYYDGKYIWGRGSSDCKNNLVAIMESLELFIDAGYEPKRTIVLAFGSDEEVNGPQGAGHIAPFLFKRYGKNGISAIVDEGNSFMKAWGSVFAAPATSEKGSTDVHITIRMPGGHSSIPTDHTSIGILSEFIVEIEAEQYSTYLTQDNPYLGQLHCGAEHAVSFPKKIRKLLERHESHGCRSKTDNLAHEAAKESRAVRYLMQTSQAVDVIAGGHKTNALPEKVSVVVNHRVNFGDEPEMVWDRLASLAKPLAKKYNLTLHAFDGVKEEAQSISLWASERTLRTAPMTPTNVDKVSPYSILAGTTRAVYGEDIIVTPGSTTGNTDTRYYWDLTKHIFRFGPGYDPSIEPGLGNIHTVDERVSVANHVGMVKWFTLFVRNMDEAELHD